jgi:hypothetical protein
MVSAWLVVKAFVVVRLTHVFAHGTVLPSLLDATADELIAGLDAGHFTSLNLVEVRHLFLSLQGLTITGLRQTHPRSQFNPSYGHRDQPGCMEDCRGAGQRTCVREGSGVS